MSERGLRLGEWNNRRQWNMGVGRRRQTFDNRDIYIYIHTYMRQSHYKPEQAQTVPGS